MILQKYHTTYKRLRHGAILFKGLPEGLSLEHFQLLREAILLSFLSSSPYKVWGNRINFMTECPGVVCGFFGVDAEFAALCFTLTRHTPAHNMTKSALKISTKLFIERAIELEMCTVRPP